MGNVLWLLLGTSAAETPAPTAGEIAGQDFVQGLLLVIVLIGIAVGVLGVFYAFFLFYLMATASTEDKRRAAKKRVVTVMSSLLIVVALTFTLYALKDSIKFSTVTGNWDQTNTAELVASELVMAITLNVSSLDSRFPGDNELKYVYRVIDKGGTASTKGKINAQVMGAVTINKKQIEGMGVNIDGIVDVEFTSPIGALGTKFWKKEVSSEGNYRLTYTLYDGQAGTGPESELTLQGNGITAFGGKTLVYLLGKITFKYTAGGRQKEGTAVLKLAIQLSFATGTATRVFVLDNLGNQIDSRVKC